MRREKFLALILVSGMAWAQTAQKPHVSPRSILEQRGPIPPWFFNIQDRSGVKYGDQGLAQGKLLVDFKLKAENSHESGQLASDMMDDRFKEIGFVRMTEKMDAQFNKWRYRKPKKEFALMAPPTYYVCKDALAFQNTLADLVFLDDRSRGKMTANARQIFLKVRNILGPYQGGFVSNHLIIEPTLVGTATWADFYVKEDLIPATFGFSKVFEPTMLFDRLEKAITPGFDGSNVSDAKFRRD
jgi:hypothetical protein